MRRVVKLTLVPATTLSVVLFLGVFLVTAIAGCNVNAGSSDSNATATAAVSTLTFYGGLEPTMTFAAAAANRAVGAQMTITALTDQNKSLVAQLNSQPTSAIPPAAPAGDSSSAQITNPGGAAPAGATPVGTAFAFTDISMAKSVDANGCAANKTGTFSVNDPKIYIVGTVHNFKAGTVFTATWSGGAIPANFHNDWTTPRDGTQMCVAFYIQPKYFNLQAGSYNVILSATGLDGTPITFTLQ
ncbi:MAG TPA: hypothetical protein VMT34_09135 [Aggregatilineales bacterium]|nr:hypothetical protein [Aggregatilineales bacterium]